MSTERLNRTLSNIDDSYDKSEGSFIYDDLKAVDIELDKQDTKISAAIEKIAVKNLGGDELTLIVWERTGLDRKLATKANGPVTITGTNGTVIPLGFKVASDTLNYTTTETKTITTGSININVECDTAGSIGNVPIGAIKFFPVTLSGLTSVTNSSAFTNGFDEETDDSLKSRYYEHIQKPSTSGNKYHYIEWAKEVVGVGNARVIPLWNGNGTVKVVIIDSNNLPADSSVVTSCQSYIDIQKPIGANVTVVSATGININVTANISLLDNYSKASVDTSITANIVAYLKEIAFVEDYVSYAKIGSIILATEGVRDYNSLLINSATANISIGNTEVAKIGTLTTTEV